MRPPSTTPSMASRKKSSICFGVADGVVPAQSLGLDTSRFMYQMPKMSPTI